MEFNAKSGLLGDLDLFGKGKQSILGVDIGTSSIKVVQLRKEKERAILETYGEIAVGPYVKLKVGQSAKITETANVEILKDLLKEAKVKAKNAVVAIPLKSSFLTVANLPVIEGGDMNQILQMEARRYIPVPVSEVILDWWIVPESSMRGIESSELSEANFNPNKKMMKVVLAAIHKDIVNTYKNVIFKADLKARAYEIETFSMVRSAINRENAPVTVIDLGASTTKLAIVDSGMVQFSHSISHGAQELTLALSHSLSVDFEKAEEMKRSIGLSDKPEHAEIVGVLEPLLDYLFSEINNFIKNYQKKYQRPMGKIILTGGGALLKGIVDYSVKKLTLETEIANAFSKVEHPAFLSSFLTEVGANFSVAMGLALRDL